MKLLSSILCALLMMIAAISCNNDNSTNSGNDAGFDDSNHSDSHHQGTGCEGLCTTAGFDGGEETDFGGGVIECVCSGTGDGISESDCDSYCEAFDVGPEDALLSMNETENDKCVCDGTSP